MCGGGHENDGPSRDGSLDSRVREVAGPTRRSITVLGYTVKH
jgi:hypothetical protein